MTTIKVANGMDINVLNIWSSIGKDLQQLLMAADTDARHDLAIVNNKMMPYATQISVMAGDIEGVFTVKTPSLFQCDIIVFSDFESELRYHALQESSNFVIKPHELHSR